MSNESNPRDENGHVRAILDLADARLRNPPLDQHVEHDLREIVRLACLQLQPPEPAEPPVTQASPETCAMIVEMTKKWPTTAEANPPDLPWGDAMMAIACERTDIEYYNRNRDKWLPVKYDQVAHLPSWRTTRFRVKPKAAPRNKVADMADAAVGAGGGAVLNRDGVFELGIRIAYTAADWIREAEGDGVADDFLLFMGLEPRRGK